MNARLFFSTRPACWAILVAAGFAGGCEAPDSGNRKDRDPLVSYERPVAFPPPTGQAGTAGAGKWTAVPREGGAEYVQMRGDMDDVVSIYGFAHPVAANLQTFEDLESFIRADSSFGFKNLRKGYVRGVPVLWFDKVAADSGAGAARLASALGARPHRADGTLLVRTRGGFLLKPGKEPQLVTVACARTSSHGEIGSYYESLFEDYLANVIQDSFH